MQAAPRERGSGGPSEWRRSIRSCSNLPADDNTSNTMGSAVSHHGDLGGKAMSEITRRTPPKQAGGEAATGPAAGAYREPPPAIAFSMFSTSWGEPVKMFWGGRR